MTLLDQLASIVGAGYVTTDPDVLAGRVVDQTGRYRGHAQALVRPGSETEVAASRTATGRVGRRTKWKKKATEAGTRSWVATVDGSHRNG